MSSVGAGRAAGAKFRCNDSGCVVPGAVIEPVTGTPYGTVRRETILPRRAAGSTRRSRSSL
jgi:CubicO group peptidase (beta-lactamase class C family)